MSTIAERVAAGVAWLDTERPGWVDEINLDELELASCCDCVIGQTFGCFAGNHPLDYDNAGALGFNTALVGEASRFEVDHLNAEWRRVITERRAAA